MHYERQLSYEVVEEDEENKEASSTSRVNDMLESQDELRQHSNHKSELESIHEKSFQEDEDFQVISEKVDAESIESEGHDETDFNSGHLLQEDNIEETVVQTNFSLMSENLIPDQQKKTSVPNIEQVEVVEEVCKEVIVKRRLASVNSIDHDGEDLDIKMAIEDEVKEQIEIQSESQFEHEKLVDALQSNPNSHAEIVEEILNEVILEKKLNSLSDDKNDDEVIVRQHLTSVYSIDHDREDSDVETAIEDEVKEQMEIHSESLFEDENFVKKLESNSNRHEEVAEEILNEVVLEKKLISPNDDVLESGEPVANQSVESSERDEDSNNLSFNENNVGTANHENSDSEGKLKNLFHETGKSNN